MKQFLFAAGWGVLLGAGCAHVQPPEVHEAPEVQQPTAEVFNFPLVNPEHEHMQMLLANAMGYLKPENGLVDPASGYPVEGWNQDSERALYLRSFTQLTAIGERLEVLANIAAGYADNPYISGEQALNQLQLMTASLLHDQTDSNVSAKGLLGNFLGFSPAGRIGPLSDEVQKQKFVALELFKYLNCCIKAF